MEQALGEAKAAEDAVVASMLVGDDRGVARRPSNGVQTPLRETGDEASQAAHYRLIPRHALRFYSRSVPTKSLPFL